MLYVKDLRSGYVPATRKTILSAAKRIVGYQLRKGSSITSSDVAKEAIELRLSAYDHEIFACLFLDSKHRVLDFREMFHGTIDHIPVFPREIVKEALRLNAAAVILAHNHPSGEVEPSHQDIELTRTLINILKVVDIKVLDHLIVGNICYSMADDGLIGKIQ